jgi:hypothetical protein
VNGCWTDRSSRRSAVLKGNPETGDNDPVEREPGSEQYHWMKFVDGVPIPRSDFR